MAWTQTVPSEPEAGTDVLARLGAICAGRGLEDLSGRLTELGELVRDDLVDLEGAMAQLSRGGTVVHRSAHHLLDLGGKRLRPMCVALGARVGTGFDVRVRDLAVAVELVHSATLLHDDVVDLGDRRRGAPTARSVYGNAASIFAGDWLLIEALRLVRRSAVPDTLDRLLGVIEEMIFAESAQLEGRGRLDATREHWLQVVEGKTAALFRWAMFAGAKAGGLDPASCEALERYGLHLGVAFQAVDDVLDLTGDSAATGKALFTDLREGKMTWPLIVAAEREPTVRPLLEQIAAAPEGEAPPEGLQSEVLDVLERTGAVADTLELARGRSGKAVACLESLPEGPAKDALVTVAVAAVSREA